MPLIGARAGGKETVCLSINTDNSNPSAICPSSGFIVIANELTVKRRMALKISSSQLRYTSWLKNEQHFILKHSNRGQANKQTQHLLFFTSEKLSEIFGVSNRIMDLWSDHILKFQALKQLKRTNIYYGFSPQRARLWIVNSHFSLKSETTCILGSLKDKTVPELHCPEATEPLSTGATAGFLPRESAQAVVKPHSQESEKQLPNLLQCFRAPQNLQNR